MRLTTTLALAVALAVPTSAGAADCAGDCDGLGSVSAMELSVAVEIALARQSLDDCVAADGGGDGEVTIDDLVRAVLASISACGQAATATPTPTATPAPTSTATAGGGQVPPTTAAELIAWLEAGLYRGWRAESQVHASVGPHFGRVRTFVNDAVFDSLTAGAEEHPRAAALVKELYGSNGDSVRGWSVMVKTGDESAGGQGWYWFERFGNSTYASGNGVSLCYGCHGDPPYAGITSKDYVLTPFPLD